jgi:hypothetical protein
VNDAKSLLTCAAISPHCSENSFATPFNLDTIRTRSGFLELVSPRQCSAQECSLPVAASLEGQQLCEEHFILASYRFLDGAAIQLRHSAHGPATAGIARGLDECMRATTRLAMAADEPNNLARARLIDILLWAADLLKQVRRGPRTDMSVAVVLAGTAGEDSWEEAAKTNTVSRHGASLHCARALAQGEVVKVRRLDNGQEGTARVVWSARKDVGNFEVGLELLNHQNLWGIDIDGSVPEVRRGPLRDAEAG